MQRAAVERPHDELEAFASRLRAHVRDAERARAIGSELQRDFDALRVRSDMLQLCDAVGRSLSLGAVLGLLGPVFAADVAAACDLHASGTLTSAAPWFTQEPIELVASGDGFVLSGRCSAAVDAQSRGELLVRAGEDRYALVPLSAAGVKLRARGDATLASAGLCSVQLREVRLTAARVGRLSAHTFERLRTRHLLWTARALCSFAAELFQETLQFLGTRPFRSGVLSDLAVVRHRLADLIAHPELFWAHTQAAIEDSKTPALRSLLLAETLSEQLPVFVKQCQQLHGGRGFLSEFSAARAYRDCLELGRLLGPRPQRRRSIARRLSETAALSGSSGRFTSKEHEGFRVRVRELVAEHVQRVASRWEADSTAVAELHALFAREGVTTRRLDGKDFSYSAILAEELMAHAPAGVAVSLMIAAGAVVPLLAREASPELREQLWPRLLRGEAVLSFGITEPDGGSDLLHSLRTCAVEEGDAWVLNGRKMFITNGPIADYVLVLARTSDKPGPFHSSFLVVPIESQGVTVSQPYETLGLRASPTGFIEFRDVRVPKHCVIGRVGLGMHYLADSIAEERTLIAIGALALAFGLVEDALERASERVGLRAGTGGADDRLITWLAKLDALRCWVAAAAQSIVTGERDYAKAGLVKFAGSEAAQEAIECAAEAIERFSELCDEPRYTCALRDTRVFTVFAGTNETLRELVGASVAARARAARKVPEHA